MKATVQRDSLRFPRQASPRVSSSSFVDERPESHKLVQLGRQAAQSPQVRQLQAQQNRLAKVAQRREVDGIPGIASIDTADYTKDELDLLFHHAYGAGRTDEGDALNDAIDEGEHKPDLAAPDRIRGLGSRQAVYILPVNLFQLDNRIPPRRDLPYPIAVLINKAKLGKAKVRLSIGNNGGANGLASVQGNDEVVLAQSASVSLRGLAQTAPGNAGRLRFVATVNGIVAAMSHPFTVAAIPQKWNLIGRDHIANEPVPGFDGEFCGMTAIEEWESDSGVTADLDEVEVDEVVEMVTKTGDYAHQSIGVRDPTTATLTHDQLDDHAIATSEITQAGKKKIHQVHTYRDARTGGGWQVVANSGYIIEQTITVKERGKRQTTFEIKTRKYGAEVTAGGISSAAGNGNQSGTVTVKKNR